MAKKPEPSVKDKPLKFEHTFEDDECISIWKYDKTKFTNGQISVEFKYKPAWTQRMKLIQTQDSMLLYLQMLYLTALLQVTTAKVI